MITLKEIKQSEEIRTYITEADRTLGALGYTDHSHAHVGLCVDRAGMILTQLGYDERTAELGRIAAYMHDIGNVVNRSGHAHSGAIMAFSILTRMEMDPKEIAIVTSAIGHHDEETAFPVHEVAAALILADKSDVRRSRVRNDDPSTFDIHDRVNYAVERSELILDAVSRDVTLDITIDTEISPVTDYFEIFLGRMMLCRKAANLLGLRFRLLINESYLL